MESRGSRRALGCCWVFSATMGSEEISSMNIFFATF